MTIYISKKTKNPELAALQVTRQKLLVQEQTAKKAIKARGTFNEGHKLSELTGIRLVPIFMCVFQCYGLSFSPFLCYRLIRALVEKHLHDHSLLPE